MTTCDKLCGRCRRIRLTAEFGCDARRPDGLAQWCRDCRRTYNAAHYRGVSEAARARNRQRRHDMTAFCRSSECAELRALLRALGDARRSETTRS